MYIKLRTLVFILVLVGVLAFAGLNWPLFTATSTMNLLFGTVIAPLGLVMLAVIAGISVLYLLLLAKTEAGAFLGNRRTAKELEEARKLALNAEESRLREMRDEFQDRLGRIEEKVTEILRHHDEDAARHTLRRDSVHVTATDHLP